MKPNESFVRWQLSADLLCDYSHIRCEHIQTPPPLPVAAVATRWETRMLLPEPIEWIRPYIRCRAQDIASKDDKIPHKPKAFSFSVVHALRAFRSFCSGIACLWSAFMYAVAVNTQRVATLHCRAYKWVKTERLPVTMLSCRYWPVGCVGEDYGTVATVATVATLCNVYGSGCLFTSLGVFSAGNFWGESHHWLTLGDTHTHTQRKRQCNFLINTKCALDPRQEVTARVVATINWWRVPNTCSTSAQWIMTTNWLHPMFITVFAISVVNGEIITFQLIWSRQTISRRRCFAIAAHAEINWFFTTKQQKRNEWWFMVICFSHCIVAEEINSHFVLGRSANGFWRKSKINRFGAHPE